MASAVKSGQVKEFIIYCGCGTVSTVADSGVYFPLVNLTSVPAPVCVFLGTTVGAVVSFLLMKPLVFHSNKWSRSVLVPEIIRFATTRILAIILEVLFSVLTVSLLGLDENVMRIIGWVLIAIGNYISSKFIVFKYRTYR